MKPDWKKFFGLSALLLCVEAYPIVGVAELHKWTDAQGNLHITDVPPPAHEEPSTFMSGSESVPPVSRVPPKKTSVKPPSSAGRNRAEIVPLPGRMAAPQPLDHRVRTQSSAGGLSSDQATVASPWEVFEGKSGNAKAGVQRWKDEQGIDHFSDLPLSGSRGG